MSPFLLGLTMARLSLCQHGGPPVAPHDPARLDWLGTDYTGLWSTVDAMDRAEALHRARPGQARGDGRPGRLRC